MSGEQFTPQMLVEHIDLCGKGLTKWETNFIANLIDRPPVKHSAAQMRIILRIYEEKC